MISHNSYFTSARVCDLTGIPLLELEWLERELGDLLEVRRTSGGHRLFTPKALDSLREIKRMLDQEAMDLAQVRSTLLRGPGGSRGGSHPLEADPDRGADSADAAEVARAVRELAEEEARRNAPAVTDLASTARLHVSDLGPLEPRAAVQTCSDGATQAAADMAWQSSCQGARDAAEESGQACAARADGCATESRAYEPDYPMQTVSLACASSSTPAAMPEDANAGAAPGSSPSVPPLPLQPTVDLLLEAAEGLVQENLKLRRALDTVADRCLRLEERMDACEAENRKRGRGFFSRS
jgi:DNA-binding transcriptional MerR regulator